MSDMMRAAILLSGGGSTAAYLLDSINNGPLKGKVKIVLVVSSNSEAGGIQKALARGFDPKDIVIINKQTHGVLSKRGQAMIHEFRRRGVDFFGQYGWTMYTDPEVMLAYPQNVNQHPGAVRGKRRGFGGPGMVGMAVHCATLEFAHNVNRPFLFTEATAHRVFPVYDEGSVLCIERVPIEPNDTPKTLQERVLPAEYRVQEQTLLAFATRTVQELELPDLILTGEEQLHDEALRIGKERYPFHT